MNPKKRVHEQRNEKRGKKRDLCHKIYLRIYKLYECSIIMNEKTNFDIFNSIPPKVSCCSPWKGFFVFVFVLFCIVLFFVLFCFVLFFFFWLVCFHVTCSEINFAEMSQYNHNKLYYTLLHIDALKFRVQTDLTINKSWSALFGSLLRQLGILFNKARTISNDHLL